MLIGGTREGVSGLGLVEGDGLLLGDAGLVGDVALFEGDTGLREEGDGERGRVLGEETDGGMTVASVAACSECLCEGEDTGADVGIGELEACLEGERERERDLGVDLGEGF